MHRNKIRFFSNLVVILTITSFRSLKEIDKTFLENGPYDLVHELYVIVCMLKISVLSL